MQSVATAGAAPCPHPHNTATLPRPPTTTQHAYKVLRNISEHTSFFSRNM
jgi:hypothetical protein